MILPIVGISALQFWLNGMITSITDQYAFDRRKLTALPEDYGFRPSEEMVRLLSERFGLTFPVCLRAPSASKRISSGYICSSVRRQGIPERSFIRLDSGFGISDGGSGQCQIYVACPELCFLSAAVKNTLYQQIRLGYDLCAIYAENPSSQYGQHSRQPLTSVGNIRDYLDNVTGFNGLRRSQAAAKYILDRSNSAKETQVAMYSILPFHLGGYALKTPSLNAFAALSPEGCRLTGHQSLMCDLIWPEDKVIAEYDSNLTHLSADQHRTDKSRATALALSGYQLFSITADNLRSFDRLEATFSALRKMLNMRSRDPELNKYRKKRLELFSFFHTW